MSLTPVPDAPAPEKGSDEPKLDFAGFERQIEVTRRQAMSLVDSLGTLNEMGAAHILGTEVPTQFADHMVNVLEAVSSRTAEVRALVEHVIETERH